MCVTEVMELKLRIIEGRESKLGITDVSHGSLEQGKLVYHKFATQSQGEC